MQRQEIVQLLIHTLTDYFQEQGISADANEQTPLFGSDSVLDSMGLVNVIVDIESRLRSNNFDVSLISEQAMSQRNSPFRSVSTLADFILTQQA
jgi:acyl carrier protein